MRWAILTGEYPSQPGGVADYTYQVAHGLSAAGDQVAVFAPRHEDGDEDEGTRVKVVRLPDHFGPRSLLTLEEALARRPRPDRLLIQYVPHAFGYKAMNLPFAAWIAARAGRFAPIWVMFHEVAFPFRWRPLSHALLATTHRIMARLVAGAASRVLVSVPGWAPLLRRFQPRLKRIEWLPIPSNIPGAGYPHKEASSAGNGSVIGHFGTYGPAVVDLLEPALCQLLGHDEDRVALLLGRGGPAFREELIGRHPALAGRIVAPGELPAGELAIRLRSCDLLFQPFMDGISSRRTSAMAGLANGVPLVSNLGSYSESLWLGSDGVRLAPDPDSDHLVACTEQVLSLPQAEREAMGRQAANLYRQRFSLDQTLFKLRNPQALDAL